MSFPHTNLLAYTKIAQSLFRPRKNHNVEFEYVTENFIVLILFHRVKSSVYGLYATGLYDIHENQSCEPSFQCLRK